MLFLLLYVMHVCLVTLGSAPFAPTEYLFLAMLLLHRELKLIKPRLKLLRVGDRGKGVPSFDEMVDFALVEVDFDDPTTNVRGRRALAIAKPTPRGY